MFDDPQYLTLDQVQPFTLFAPDQCIPDLTIQLQQQTEQQGDGLIREDSTGGYRFSATPKQAKTIFDWALAHCREDGDVAILPRHFKTKLLICDMDMTMVASETLDDVAELAGLGPAVANITDRAMRGELDFYVALRERMALIKGQPAQLFQQALENVQLHSGAERLIAAANSNGAVTVLISGGFEPVVSAIAQRLGFQHAFSNALLTDAGLITGELAEPLVDKTFKQNTLKRLCQELGITRSQTVAMGDGANDIPMLQAAGIGIAYHAKPNTQTATRYRINHGDLGTVKTWLFGL